MGLTICAITGFDKFGFSSASLVTSVGGFSAATTWAAFSFVSWSVLRRVCAGAWKPKYQVAADPMSKNAAIAMAVRQKLERNVAFQLLIAGMPNHTHCSTTNHRLKRVSIEQFLSGRKAANCLT
jgi:hypothetical protein